MYNEADNVKPLIIMDILIFKCKKNQPILVVDYEKLVEVSLSIDDHLEYNDLLAKTIGEKLKERRYLASPTLTRIEAQTGLFDKICRYIKILDLLDKEKINLLVKNVDYTVFQAIKEHSKGRRIKLKYSFISYVLGNLSRHHVRFVCKLLLALIYEFILMTMAKILMPNPDRSYRYFFISFFDDRSQIKDGSYQDQYFQPLINYLQRRKECFCIVLNLLSFRKVTLTVRHMIKITRMNRAVNVLTSYSFMSYFDLFRLCVLSFASWVKLKQNVVYKGRNITKLINLSLCEDMVCRNNWFFTNKIYLIAGHLFNGCKIERVIYPYENHPWEKMLVLRRDETRSRTKLIAFQHTSISLKELNHFPAAEDKLFYGCPDKILTVGGIVKKMMDIYGHYPAGVVQEGCALRHSYLFKEELNNNTGRSIRKRVAMAFSSDAKTYPSLIKNLVAAFKESDIVIYLKSHPLLDENIYLPRDLPDNFIKAAKVPWKTIFSDIDLLFYHDNTLALDAMRYGVAPCYFGMAGDVYNCDRLFFYEENKNIVLSLDGLKQFVEEYYSSINGSEKNVADLCGKYFYDYLSPITEEKMNLFIS